MFGTGWISGKIGVHLLFYKYKGTSNSIDMLEWRRKFKKTVFKIIVLIVFQKIKKSKYFHMDEEGKKCLFHVVNIK